MMSDVELSNYFPVHGDRLRRRQYLNDSRSVVDNRNKLLKTLHEKMEQAKHRGKTDKNYSSSDEESSNMRRHYGNKNALKGSRIIEIGWVHKTHQRVKQVRSKTGGGTRKFPMDKNSKKEDILREAKLLFFPDGNSPKGKISDMDFDI
ncbi:hypothetical protein ACF0H5_009363 [Mactra antiquata]